MSSRGTRAAPPRKKESPGSHDDGTPGKTGGPIGGSPKKSEHESSDYVLPNPKVLEAKYDLFIDSEAKNASEEFEKKKQVAILNSIENNSNLVDQNQKLLRLIDQKNREVEQLQCLLEAVESPPGAYEKYKKLVESGCDENIDFRDSKIVDLAKKVRRLNVCLNKEKSTVESQAAKLEALAEKCDQLQIELELANRRNAGGSSRATRAGVVKDQPAGGESEEKLQRELHTVTKQVEEYRKKNAAQSEEVKNLTRALARELGEGVTVEQAVDGGWRGRAQQIVMLKAKIRKLEAGGSAGGNNSNRVRNDVDAKAEEDLANMTRDRNAAIEALTEERAQLIEHCQQLETKQKGHKARIKAIEADSAKQKQNLQILIEKTEADDQLVEALKEEIRKLAAQLQAAKAQVAELQDAGVTKTRTMRADGAISTTSVRAGGGLIAAASSRNGSDVVGGAAMTLMDVELEASIQRDKLEIQRLTRLCKQQAEQLNTQDGVIRQLRASKQNFFGEDG